MEASEILKTTEPPSTIVCKDCKYRLPPINIKDVIIERYAYGACAVFQNKPTNLLWNHADCELYEKE